MVKSLLKPAPLTLAILLLLAVPAVVLQQPGNRLAQVLGVLVVLFCSGLLAFSVHELGHVVSGLLSGYRFVALICGPLAVSRAGGRLQARWNDLWSLYPGATMMAPSGARLPPIRDAVALYAGGPLTSLTLGVLLVSLYFGFHMDSVKWSTIAAGTHTIADKLLGDATFGVGLFSLAIAVATMPPHALGGFLSDGAAVRMLLKGGPEADRLRAINALMGQLFEGGRPRDWTPEFVEVAASLHDGSAVEDGAAGFAFLHAIDRGDLSAARGHLARMEVASGNSPGLSQGALRVAVAWLAVADGRIAEARVAFEQLEGTVVEEFSRQRVLAAILLAEGKVDEGMAAAHAGLTLIEQADQLFLGVTEMEREWLEQLAQGRLPTLLTSKGSDR